ncbi:helix-turn-helix domain-containing protein [Dyadobacter sandarakinus]|uniref:Helix-turn-helix transcriptional regulator n=1 Tax=Dyadobacter sandarakinus TaxID=2747268 RepID=A0ABX7I3B0_9BACT|nr:helix-turn-helix transcriptional regulator [Dyadobacter sandarakinus]QRR00037.1 helix-turn-helix transcriptional regulator [Dyadobacter sandarakinus]
MSEIVRLESVSQFNNQRGQKTLHPLVSVLDQSKSSPIQGARFVSELYIIFLKELKCAEMKYGRNHYDYQDGTLLFIAPGQVFGFDEEEKTFQPTGWALTFHPDLIRGTSLGRSIKDYGFFSYDANEALHLSDRERETILDSFSKIRYELEHAIDKHSKILIISNIELFLNYCVRFYDRQFITRDNLHKDVLARFERAMDDFFKSDNPQILGLPSVKFFAEQLNLSANYFGDLVKKETGKSAQEHLQEKLITIAKERVLDSSKSISEIAYEIGFKYPSHFTRLFKKQVGQSPLDYRLSNN